MTSKIKQKFTLLFTILTAFAVYLWFYPLNKGIAVISANVTNYKVITASKNYRCNKNPCKIKHKTGTWSFFIQKDGFAPVTKTLTIKRGNEVSFKAELIKIVKLELSNIIPVGEGGKPKKAIPPTLSVHKLVKPMWNNSQTKLAYLDSKDERLKIWSSEGEQIITVIQNLESPLNLTWSHTERQILGTTDKSIFLIGIREGSRHKITPAFKPKNALWSPNGSFVLINNESNKIFRIDFATQKITALKTTADLSLTTWINKNILLIAKKDADNNRLSIQTFDPIEDTSEEITSKFNLEVDRLIFENSTNTAYARSPVERVWYKMKF